VSLTGDELRAARRATMPAAPAPTWLESVRRMGELHELIERQAWSDMLTLGLHLCAECRNANDPRT
jgi:hypothetical protein